MSDTIIVTRHPALVTIIRERGLAPEDCPVLTHVTADDVRGKHVIGVLPNQLAAEAVTITEIPLVLTLEDRGKELGVERMREVAGEAVTYRVTRVSRVTVPWVDGDTLRTPPSWTYAQAQALAHQLGRRMAWTASTGGRWPLEPSCPDCGNSGSATGVGGDSGYEGPCHHP